MGSELSCPFQGSGENVAKGYRPRLPYRWGREYKEAMGAPEVVKSQAAMIFGYVILTVLLLHGAPVAADSSTTSSTSTTPDWFQFHYGCENNDQSFLLSSFRLVPSELSQRLLLQLLLHLPYRNIPNRLLHWFDCIKESFQFLTCAHPAPAKHGQWSLCHQCRALFVRLRCGVYRHRLRYWYPLRSRYPFRADFTMCFRLL